MRTPKNDQEYPTNTTNSSRMRRVSLHHRIPSSISTDNRVRSPMANNQTERPLVANQKDNVANPVSPSGLWSWLGNHGQSGSDQVCGFGIGDLMGKNRVPTWNKWRLIMEPEDEAKMRMPIKEMNEEMMEAMIRQKELLIQKKIPFGAGDWGGHIKDEEKVSAAPGGEDFKGGNLWRG